MVILRRVLGSFLLYLHDHNTATNMTIAGQRFGKHYLKAEIAMSRSGSPFARQRLAKMRSHVNENLTKNTVAKDRITTNCWRW
jgi:phage terminase large subunit-like protein